MGEKESPRILTIQRSEIFFNGKKSVLINFRKLAFGDGEESEIFNEVTKLVPKTILKTLYKAETKLEELRGKLSTAEGH